MSASSVKPAERDGWAYRELMRWMELEKTGSVTFHLHRGSIGAVELKERVTQEDHPH